MAFSIGKATVNDAEAIAHIFSSNESDGFWQLQMGTVDPNSLNTGLTERIAETMQKPNQAYVVARDSETGVIASYAQWTLPHAEQQVNQEYSPAEKAEAAEAYQAKLVPGMNVSLIMEFREKYEEMRKGVAGGRRYFLLGNLGTLPTYQRRGAASALTKWPFEAADREGIPVCLDTDEDGHARVMYEKLGFERVGQLTIDLTKHGGQGTHTHIAMVREPKSG